MREFSRNNRSAKRVYDDSCSISKNTSVDGDADRSPASFDSAGWQEREALFPLFDRRRVFPAPTAARRHSENPLLPLFFCATLFPACDRHHSSQVRPTIRNPKTVRTIFQIIGMNDEDRVVKIGSASCRERV